jgi:hypothetical protein
MKLNRSWLMTLGLVGLGAALILPSLGISLGALLPFLFILLCPLMHLFMMRGGHGGHAGHDHGTGAAEPPPPPAQAPPPAAEKKALEGGTGSA